MTRVLQKIGSGYFQNLYSLIDFPSLTSEYFQNLYSLLSPKALDKMLSVLSVGIRDDSDEIKKSVDPISLMTKSTITLHLS